MTRRGAVWLALLAGVLALVAPISVAAADGPSTMRPGTTLHANDFLQSYPQGQVSLIVSEDGNVTLSQGHVVTFQTGTAGHPGASLTLQSDGNLVLYDVDGRALWANQVFIGPSAQVNVLDDGTLCESSGGGPEVWCVGRYPLYTYGESSVLSRGQSLHPSTLSVSSPGLSSPSGRFRLYLTQYYESWGIFMAESEAGLGVTTGALVWQPARTIYENWVLTMQDDGNLVAYCDGVAIWATGTAGSGADRMVVQDDGNIVLYAGGRAVWASGTTPRVLVVGQTLTPGTRWTAFSTDQVQQFDGTLVMQTDGNLVTYNAAGRATWSTGTAGHPGAYGTLQVDGNFVVYDTAGRPLWASGTRGLGHHITLYLVNPSLGRAGVQIVTASV